MVYNDVKQYDSSINIFRHILMLPAKFIGDIDIRTLKLLKHYNFCNVIPGTIQEVVFAKIHSANKKYNKMFEILTNYISLPKYIVLYNCILKLINKSPFYYISDHIIEYAYYVKDFIIEEKLSLFLPVITEYIDCLEYKIEYVF